ncbi:EAL domain-containing protein [Arthrobacter sp. NA-172]|uniref:EAL domain-containing protein n=1 Tax=Arthrobacter sp. NA-172 TaxID=3367524 RepID=UPI0037544FEE
MSTQKPSVLALTDAQGRAAPETSGLPATSGLPVGGDLSVLRRQVQEIIDEVLADTSPASAEVREQLSRHVDAHPDQPEKALLEHLTSLRPEESVDGVADMPVPETPVPETPEPVSHPRLEAVLRDRMLMTAFQPIYDLVTGTVIGAEALTRFVSDGGDPADYWFAEAEDIGLRTDLEFAALESALTAALDLPPQLFVALKLSHAACLDPRLPALFDQSPVEPVRIVLEISGHFAADQNVCLDAVLASLRAEGMRLSIENTGSYFASVGHILRLRPEMIKLDRSLTAGIDQDTLRQELVAAEVEFARQIGAALTAQRIETADELAAVKALGITVGEGYHLGRPSVQPRDWAAWGKAAGSLTHPGSRGRAIRSGKR